MSWQLHGMPLHPLLVHLSVVAVPAACLLAIAVALRPRARRWAGLPTPVLAAIAAVSTVLSKESGERLADATPPSALIERHAQLADALVPWTLGVLAIVVVQAAWTRWGRPGRAVSAIMSVLQVLVAIGCLICVVLVGDAGAAAVWTS